MHAANISYKKKLILMSDRAHSAQVITDTRNLHEYPVVLCL